LIQKSIIRRVRADPEPIEIIASSHADNAIVHPDSRREDWPRRVDLAKSETRMPRIFLEQRIGSAGLGANVFRKRAVERQELRHQE